MIIFIRVLYGRSSHWLHTYVDAFRYVRVLGLSHEGHTDPAAAEYLRDPRPGAGDGDSRRNRAERADFEDRTGKEAEQIRSHPSDARRLGRGSPRHFQNRLVEGMGRTSDPRCDGTEARATGRAETQEAALTYL